MSRTSSGGVDAQHYCDNNHLVYDQHASLCCLVVRLEMRERVVIVNLSCDSQLRFLCH